MKAKQRNTLKLGVALSQTSSSNCILTPDILLRQSQLLRARSHAGSNCFFWLSSLYCSLLKRLYSQYALSQLRFHSMLFWVQILQACLIWGSPFADPTQYSGHSLRAGLATSAAQAGVPTWRIRAQTRHASDAMLARYIRDGEMFTDNAAGALL